MVLKVAVDFSLRLVSSANAQNVTYDRAFLGFSEFFRDMFVPAVLGLSLLYCFRIVQSSDKPAKIAYAKDAMKIILGFLGGYSGGNSLRR